MLRAFTGTGTPSRDAFQVDFTKEKLGRPHHMKFTAKPAQQVALCSPVSDDAEIVLAHRCPAPETAGPDGCDRGVAAAALAVVDPGVASAPRLEFTPPRPGQLHAAENPTRQGCGSPRPVRPPVRCSRRQPVQDHAADFLLHLLRRPAGLPVCVPHSERGAPDIQADASLAQRVRFASVSLDPSTDTPEAIGRYRDMCRGHSTPEWQVLTAASVRQLLPILEDFGQDVSIERAADGWARRTVHHMLKMFLIDHAGKVREIYTLAYLQPAVIANDIRTLYLEEIARARDERVAGGPTGSARR